MARFAQSGFIVVLLAFGACAGEVSDRIPLEQAVLGTVLDSLFAGDGGRVFLINPVYVYPLIGRDRSDPSLQADTVDTERMLEMKGVPRDLAHDFVIANARLDSVHLPIPARRPVVMDTLTAPLKVVGDSIRARGRFGSGFERVARAYPGAHQVIGLARAGFSPDQSAALVLYTFDCGKLCGGAQLVRLVRGKGRWQVVETFPLWAS